MPSVLRSISAVALVVLLFLLLPLSAVVDAQTVPGGSPGGPVDCSISGPAFQCNTGQIPNGVSCQFLNGQYYCYDSGGEVGIQCTYDSSGSLNCQNTGTSNNVGGTGTGGNASGGFGNVTNGSNALTGGGWLDKLTAWIANAIHAVFQALVSLLMDMLIAVFVAVFTLVELIVNSIKPPAFLSTYSLGALLGQTGSIVGFFMYELNIGIALGMIGVAYAFRLLRKFATLFQW